MFGVLADGHVGAVAVDDDGGDDFAGAVVGGVFEGLAIFGAILDRIGVVAEEFLEGLEAVLVGVGLGVVAVAPAVAAAPDDHGLALDVGVGGGAPAGVQDALRDLGGFFAEEFAGVFVHGDERGREGGGDVEVRPIDAVGGGDENAVADNQGGAAGDVVGENPEVVADVGDPEDVGALVGHGDGFAVDGGELRLVHIGPLVAVGLALDVKADDLAAIGNDVAAVALDGDGGAEADIFPVADLAGADLRDDELPEERAGLFVETHEDAAVADLGGIAGGFVVGTDEDAAAGDARGAVGLGAEFGDPADVLGGFGIDGFSLREEFPADDIGGDALARGDHVAAGRAAPHGPIAREGGGGGADRSEQRQGEGAKVIHWR